MTGWLAEQLPRPLAEDPFLQRFLGIFEKIAASVHDRIDGIEHHLDPGLAPPEFVRWIAGWLALAVDSGLPVQRQRALVRQAATLIAWRGTRRALEGLLEALTGDTAEVSDRGGVFAAGNTPPADRRVTVRLARTGGVEERRLLELIQNEIPVGATVDLVVTSR